MSAVFVDTSAFYALYSASDGKHRDALTTLRELHRRRAALVTTDVVLIESYVLVHARGGLESLLQFRGTLAKSSWLEIMTVASDQQARAWDLLEQRTDQGYSFVDATSFVMMRALGIRQAFSFDVHFSQEGFERLGERRR